MEKSDITRLHDNFYITYDSEFIINIGIADLGDIEERLKSANLTG